MNTAHMPIFDVAFLQLLALALPVSHTILYSTQLYLTSICFKIHVCIVHFIGSTNYTCR